MALPRPTPRPTGVPGSANAPVTTMRKPVTSSKAPAFIRATSQVRRRAIVNIQGPEKTGKDHMAFTYTGGPIYVHSFDIGLEGVIQKFQTTREIYVAEYEIEVQPGEGTDREVGESANKVWNQFVSNFKDSIASTVKEGLVIADTGTEVWELLRLASFGKLAQVMPHMYAKPSAEMRDLVRSSYDGCNVAWLHKMTDEWENTTDSSGKEKGRKTGRKARKSFGDMPFLVQVNVETSKTQVEGGGAEFLATIIDCRLNPSCEGMVLDNDFNALLDLALGA